MKNHQDLKKRLLQVGSVRGVWLYDSETDAFHIDSEYPEAMEENSKLKSAIREIPEQIQEAELIFEKVRILFRRTFLGKIVVLMDPTASGALARLKLELLIADMEKRNPNRTNLNDTGSGIGRRVRDLLFQRRIICGEGSR